MSADPIIYCLEHLTDYWQFERLCSDLMAAAGYPAIDPLGGTNDRGRDAIDRTESVVGDTIFAYTVRVDWRKKLEEDCQRIKAEDHRPLKVIFVCTSALAASEKDKARRDVLATFGWELELYDLERVRVLLTGPHRHLIAQHPAIFCPPFFPQVGGLSIAQSPDTVVIDHVSTDHALASWLARKLSLDGYLTWSVGIAPLAGESIDASVRTLLQTRAAQYIPILSPAALKDRDFMDRCGAAGTRADFLLPCWSSSLMEALKGSRLGSIKPARFDTGWAGGLREVIAQLNSRAVKRHHSTEAGRAIALRAYFPEPVVSDTPGPVFANVFPATVPDSILICRLDRPLTEAEVVALRRVWAFVEADQTTLLSFIEPPATVPSMNEPHLPAYSWADIDRREGKRSVDVVKELVWRSLDVACAGKGLSWCDNRHVFYFPNPKVGQTNAPIRHVDGRDTHVAMNGQRQYGRGVRASTFQYQLGPRFRVGRDERGAWWVTTKLYVRVVDTSGVPFELKDIGRRRKAVTRSWWNKEWLARLLGVMQALRTHGSEIQVGSGARAVTVSSVPVKWSCPISIDVAALERARSFEQEMDELRALAERDDVDEDEDEDDSVREAGDE